MTFSAQMTSQDCYEVARRKTTIITSQRKLHRLLKAISEKERYAALYQSKFMCERYDSEIESLYDKVAFLEGHVMANELELAHIEAKRREAEVLRIVRLFQLTAPTLEPAAPTPTLQASSTPQAHPLRAKQLAMFGPGPAPIDTTPVGNRSAADREWAIENDIAVGMALANETREEGKSESASETEKVVAKPEPQPPFTFAYTFDPPKPDSQHPNSQRADSQSPDSQRPVVVEKKSAGVLKEDSYPGSARDAAGVQRAEGAEEAACEDATLLAQKQKEEI
jgi:hypothetical protein